MPIYVKTITNETKNNSEFPVKISNNIVDNTGKQIYNNNQ